MLTPRLCEQVHEMLDEGEMGHVAYPAHLLKLRTALLPVRTQGVIDDATLCALLVHTALGALPEGANALRTHYDAYIVTAAVNMPRRKTRAGLACASTDFVRSHVQVGAALNGETEAGIGSIGGDDKTVIAGVQLGGFDAKMSADEAVATAINSIKPARPAA